MHLNHVSEAEEVLVFWELMDRSQVTGKPDVIRQSIKSTRIRKAPTLHSITTSGAFCPFNEDVNEA